MSTVSLFTRRDPFTEFDNLVRSTFATPSSPTNRQLDFTPAVETRRDGDDVVVRVELPGVDVSSDVSVEIVDQRLVIKGERRDERSEPADDESGQVRSRRISEIRYGSFERSFALPAHVKADAISAGYEAGILSVRVGGVYAGTEPTRIQIDTGA